MMNLYSYSIIFLVLLLASCLHSQKQPEGKLENKDSVASTIEFKDPRTDIDKAMDAFNEIQVNGDGSMMLYLTFPNTSHSECKGEVYSFEITKEEFHQVLLEVIMLNNHKITIERRHELAFLASKPWEIYTVTSCGSTNLSQESEGGTIPPHKGTWIIKEVFGRSDLLINW